MRDQPEPTEEEQDLVPERLEEEDAMRYPGHETDELPAEKPADPKDPIHEA